MKKNIRKQRLNSRSYSKFYILRQRLTCLRQTDSSSGGFTLLELLIVIGILAILGAVAIWVLNPIEFMKQSRDSNRITDLMAVRGALDLVAFEEKSLGTTNYVSISIPDSDLACGNLGLPALPATWSYRCVTSTNLRKVDGNGWIPVDFTKLSVGSPISNLPIDPVNSTSTGQYYAYITGPSFKLTALFESEKLAPYMNKDGGPDPGLYEIGSASRLSLANFHRGLVGYWNLDGNALDSSGYGNNGTITGGTTWTTGKNGSALSFNGIGQQVTVPDSTTLNLTTSLTLEAWVNPSNSTDDYQTIIQQANTANNWYTLQMYARAIDAPTSYAPVCRIDLNGNGDFVEQAGGTSPLPANTWSHIACTYDGSAIRLYVNGNLQGTYTGTGSVPGSAKNYEIGNNTVWNESYPGLIDDLRIYNRAFSATEIKAIYSATK